MRSKSVFLYVDTQFNVSKINFNMKNSNSKYWLGFGRFFWRTQKQMKMQPTFQTTIFQNISTFIKLNICISKTKFWQHFPQRVYYWQDCFDECALFHAITGRYYILYKLFVILRYSSTIMFLPSFETSVLKDVRILFSFSPLQN